MFGIIQFKFSYKVGHLQNLFWQTNEAWISIFTYEFNLESYEFFYALFGLVL